MFENEKHIRVTKVETSDGMNPIFDDNGHKKLKVVHAPYNSITLKGFAEQNEKLPTHLKMVIEVIDFVPTKPLAPGPDAKDLQIKALQERLAAMEEKTDPKAVVKVPVKEKETV